jgi:PAS domain S-box-containing protein
MAASMPTRRRTWPAWSRHPSPTGAQHHVGVNELFFSTTDRLGVIEQANSVFVRLSGYQRDELVGAPHNIIRHPMMPGAAFRVMWDTLEAGEPFGAYVHNMASTGSRYDVFATITPLRGGYLSVRARPMCPDVLQLVDSLYGETWQLEQELRAQGLSRHQAAEQGVQKLAGMIAAAGIGTYNDFLMDALPREVEAREAAGEVCPERPYATGPLRHMLDTVWQLHQQLGHWMADLSRLDEQVNAVQAGARDLLRVSAEASSTAQLISSVEGLPFDFMPLMMPLQLWTEMDTEVRVVVDQLITQLDQASASASRTRFRIALARLHATMIGNFIAELIDGLPGARDAAPAIGLLTQAISEGIGVLEAQSRQHAALSSQVSEDIDQVAGLMQMPIDLLGSWIKASDRELPASIAELVPRVTQQVQETNWAIGRLRELGGALHGWTMPDPSPLQHTVAELSHTAARLARQHNQQPGVGQ